MTIRISGVDLVVKNLSGFLSGMKQGEKATERLDIATAKVKLRLESMEVAAKKMAAGYVSSVGNIERAQLRVRQSTIELDKLEAQQQARIAKGKVETKAYAKALDDVEKAKTRLQIASIDLQKAILAEAVAIDSAVVAQEKYELALAEGTKESTSFTQNIMGVIGGTTTLSAVFPQLAPVITAVGVAFGVANIGTNLFSKAMGVVKSAISIVISALQSMGNVVKSVFNFFLGILAKLTQPLRTFLQHVLEIASGIALWRAIRNIGVAFRNLSEEIMNAIFAFQGLEIRLDVLAARDYAKAFGAEMVDAFKATSGAAAELFDWMRKLAVRTPFTVQDIANQFALANAMGLSIEKTKELTTATTNFTSALNLSDETLWRIVYNMGQMIQRGKLSGEEFRDLARNMIPIDQIMQNLADSAGMAKEAYRELALEGGVPVMDFLNEFIRIANTDYPDAAARMAKTWQGVTNNVKDFIQSFLGFDLLKPVFDKFTATAADMLDKLIKNVELMNSFKLMGQTLLKVFEYLTPFVDRFVDALLNVGGALDTLGQKIELGHARLSEYSSTMVTVYNWAKLIAKGFIIAGMAMSEWLTKGTNKIIEFSGTAQSVFKTIISKAFEWGLGFIKSFSQGIAWAINYVLLPAIKLVTSILAYFFKTKSPPLIAPDIDKWGAETMNEWIKGFTLADFSLFNDVADLVESYIRSLGSNIEEINMIPIILNVRGDLAQSLDAVRQGALSVADAVTRIVNAIGYSQGDFTAYITSLFQIAQAEEAVAAASKVVEEAQAEVNRLRKAYNAIAEDSPQLIAAELAVEQATTKVKVAQDELNDVTEYYDAILDHLRSQLSSVTEEYDETVRLREIEKALTEEVLTADERERLEMEKKGILIKREIRSVEEQRDAAVSVAEAKLKQAKAEQEAAELLVETIKTQIEQQQKLLQIQIDIAEARLEEAKAVEEAAKVTLKSLELQAEAQKAVIEAQIEFNRLMQEQLDLLKKLEEEKIPEAEPPPEPPDVKFSLEQWLKDLQSIWDEAQKDFDALKVAWEEAKASISSAWDVGGAGKAIDDLTVAFEGLIDVIGPITGEEGLIAKFKGKLKDIDTWIREKFAIPPEKSIVDWAIGEFEEAKERFDKIIGPWNLGMLHGFGLLAAGARLVWIGLDILTTRTDEFGNVIDVDGATILGWFLGLATLPFRIVAVGFLNMAATFAIWCAELKLGAQIVATAVNWIVTVLGQYIEVIKAIITAYSTGDWISAARVVETAMSTIRDVVSQSLDDTQSHFEEFKENIKRIAEEMSNLLVGNSIFPDMMSGIESSVSEGLNKTNKAWYKGMRKLTKTADAEFSNMMPMFNSSFQAQQVLLPGQMQPGNVDRSTHIEVNPTYKNYESEAGIYYDLAAALAASWR